MEGERDGMEVQNGPYTSKVMINPMETRAGFLVWITQYLKRALSKLQLSDLRHILYKIAKESLQNPVDQRCCANMLHLQDLACYLRDNYVTNVDMVGDLLAVLIHRCPIQTGGDHQSDHGRH